MQSRTLWIVLGTIAATLLICVVGAVATFVLLRPYIANVIDGRQREAQVQPSPLAPSLATAEPTLENIPTERPATPTVVVTPSASSRPSPPATANPPTPAVQSSDDFATALVAATQAELTNHPNVTRYQIQATLDPRTNTIVGEQQVQLTNTEDVALDEVYFRLYVNAPHYNEGGIVVDEVAVNGQVAQAALELDDTALKVNLTQPLAPDQTLTLSMRFTTTVPDSGGGYGIFNESNGTFTLYNWHPEVAVYENGDWLLNPVSDQGDPTNTDVANYAVTFVAPEDYTVVTGGVETAAAPRDGNSAHSFIAPLTRNFVVVASDQFERVTQQVGETTVASYYLPGDQQGGRAVLETASESLKLFSQQFGAYPFTELDVVEVQLGGGAAGMEATGLIMISSEYYDQDAANALGGIGDAVPGAAGADVLAFTTAHEVAHQWWYSTVGSDAYQQPWLDESLTNWSSAYYVDEVVGDEAGLLARDLFIGLPYRSVLSRGDERLDQPVDTFSGEEYGAIVYGKGALMYDVLRQELGDQAFFEFLQRYYQEQQFDRADGKEWLQTLNAVADKDMTPFYEKWVVGDTITPADLPPAGPLSRLFGGG